MLLYQNLKPQQGDVIVIQARGAGKGLLRLGQIIDQVEVHRFDSGEWTVPDACVLKLV